LSVTASGWVVQPDVVGQPNQVWLDNSTKCGRITQPDVVGQSNQVLSVKSRNPYVEKSVYNMSSLRDTEYFINYMKVKISKDIWGLSHQELMDYFERNKLKEKTVSRYSVD
jgi:hypothetical protein